MSALLERPGAAPSAPRPGRRRWAWVRPVCAGVALLLAGVPIGAVVQGGAWAVYAAGAVAVVVAVGIGVEAVAGLVSDDGAGRAGAVGVALAQLAALALAATGAFATSGVATVLPGPAAVAELGALVDEAATQVRTGVAPVAATPAMLLLVAGAFGVTAVAVHAVAVGARAPAVAGVLLLAVFAVPTALADDLMPAWMLASAGAGFGLLLLSGPAGRPARRAPVAVALTAAAVAASLAVGAAAGEVGTAGRFADSGAGSTRAGEIGLSPFTALRGQLQQGASTELFRVTGLPRPTYLRALTLSSYVPGSGWQPGHPGAGAALPGALPAATVPGDRATVTVDNAGFRDYWLPLFGVPLGVDGVAVDRWSYDPTSGIAYSTRPRREDAWTQDVLLPTPSAAQLRAGDDPSGVGAAFTDTAGIDPRVAALARQVTAGAPTGFDRAVALQQWFTGPDSAFRYDLATAPGNGDDAMVEFLTRGRRGYCEQFASSMAAMLRTVGVPARVAVGFTGGRADGDARSVSTSDAHAWVEAWFAGAGWTTFDPTPLDDGRAMVPPYVAEALGQGDTDRPTDVPTASAEPAPAEPPAAPDSPAPAATAPAPTAEPPAPDTPVPAADPVGPVVLRALVGVLAVGAAGLLVAAPALWRGRLRRRRSAAAAAGGPGAADAAWAELVAESTDRGVPAHGADTVRDTARRMVEDHGLDARAADAVRAVADVVEESWYGGVDPAPGALGGPVDTAVRGMALARPLGLRRRLLPPSVLDALRARRPRGRRAGDASAEAGAPSAADDHAGVARR